MTLDDALFNWLQIKFVSEQRPEDRAAQETFQFFTEILLDDFKLQDIQVQREEGMYILHYVQDKQQVRKQFPLEFVQQLYHDIESEPKYNQ